MLGIFAEPAPKFAAERVRAVLREHWALTDVELGPLDSERDLNVLVDGRFVLKISNPAESAEVVDMETRALEHVRTADPSLPVPETIGEIVRTGDDSGRECLARLITLLPGAPLEGRPLDLDLAAQVGAIAGCVSVALQGFFHPAAGRSLLWDVRQMPDVVASAGIGMAGLVDRVRPALAATAALPSGIQHADVTLTNVLAGDGVVTGVIDFGDMHHTAKVADLAVTLASVLRGSGEEDRLWRLAEAVLRGYQRQQLLSTAEVVVLGELVIARLLTTLAVSALRRGTHADNVRYITQYDNSSNRTLELLTALPPDDLADRLNRLAGTRDLTNAIAPTSLPGRRADAMGGPLSPLFYRQPLELVRGEGPWLFARDNTRYLDAYNNVAVIGHAHPAVTRAVGRQLAELNTHSRYLHAGIVDLAERILATMPDPLDTVLFTTSGTEANELAWRLATEYTGATAAVIAEHAYHGASKWLADLSSNEWPAGYRPAHVATFEAPRGEGLTETVGAQRISLADQALRATGERPALVLADSQFTSEGILDVPGEFVAGLVNGAHAAGAVYLADEVQSGYGRSGPQLWRFLLAGVTPDLVTLGKPMGAGYPIGAVVTRREIADVLASRYEYFSTFAATPAAAAAGHAVLDVLTLTGLPDQAVAIGELLRNGLRDLASTEPMLGQVRGVGLLAGVDVASREAAKALVSELVDQGVLAGNTGPRGDVLKVRPPLVWEERHVALFLDRLRRALSAIA
jgi:4-aminobutyrate aminotransferase-like enzyme/Ser/Thr protein kinase RdoA (MazF antagonist)